MWCCTQQNEVVQEYGDGGSVHTGIQDQEEADEIADLEDEIKEQETAGLSDIGRAAYEVLSEKHGVYKHRMWNLSTGKIIGDLRQTPSTKWVGKDDPPDGHDDWFPETMGDIIGKTRIWCDITSLAPPEGLFMTAFKRALKTIAVRAEREGREDNPVIVRMMFGNVLGMPVNCHYLLLELVKDIPESAAKHIRLWVGAWRKGVSWNHSKIIAVDGLHLHNGGHNLFDRHYLKVNPIHDVSLQLEGRVAHDGHLFANDQWTFIEAKQGTLFGEVVDQLPDNMEVAWTKRVTVSEYPTGLASTFPPLYAKRLMPRRPKQTGDDVLNIITMGRLGTLVNKARPADDAFINMMVNAKTIIRMAQQDIGPMCLPGTKVAVPGCVWPKSYLEALGEAIWTRSVDVEIALSNPQSNPDHTNTAEAAYGNGWTCVDVASEVIKAIRNQYPESKDEDLRQKVADNLRVCYIRERCGNAWKDGNTMGLHSKHVIVDDVCAYIGSQNFYVCDLAEWGIVVDSKSKVKWMMDQYWNPMWTSSYTGEDCDVQAVMDGLSIDRDGDKTDVTDYKNMAKAARIQAKGGTHEFYDEEDADQVADEK